MLQMMGPSLLNGADGGWRKKHTEARPQPQTGNEDVEEEDVYHAR